MGIRLYLFLKRFDEGYVGVGGMSEQWACLSVRLQVEKLKTLSQDLTAGAKSHGEKITACK